MKTLAKILALVALLAAPLLAQPSGQTLPRVNPTFSGTLTGPLEVLNQPGIATTSTDALTLQNATASTGGVTVQYSPRLHFVSHAWNTTATAADNYLEAIEELRPISAGTPSAYLAWATRLSTAGSGSFVDALRVYTDGTILAGGLTTKGTGVLQFPAGAADNTSGLGFAGSTYVFKNGVAGQLELYYPSGSGSLGIGGSVGHSIGIITTSGTSLLLQTGASVTGLSIDGSQNTLVAKKITSYNGVSTAGWGVGAIQAAAEVTAQSAAGNITSYTVGAADGVFRVSADMDVTVATAVSTTLTVTYTDKANVAKTMILPVQQLAGTFIAGGLITGTGDWESATLQIRCKASTTITILVASGTFTGVTFSASGIIEQVN